MYIDRAYIESKISTSRLNQIIGLGNDIDVDKLNGLILDAQSEVNLILSRSIDTSTIAPDENIQRLTYDIFLFYLESIARGEVSDDVITRYRNALKRLQEIADNKIELPEGVASKKANPSTSGNIRTNKTSSDKIFTKEKLNSMT